MKFITRILSPALLCCICFLRVHAADNQTSAPPGNRDYVIGLSPFLQKSVKDDVFRRIARLLLEELPLGSSLAIYDAYHLRTVAELKIPEVVAFKSGKTRATQFKEAILRLKEFLSTEHARPETTLSLDYAIRFPQFLDFVATHKRGDDTTMIIVLGSPLYVDVKEPGFSMVNGYFPSDGHLQATRDQSIYGLKGRKGFLENFQVHFGYFGDPWVSELHQARIARFWSLYLNEQQGALKTFCADLATTFKAATGVTGADEASLHADLDRSQTKLEMLRVTREGGLTDWITRALPANHQQPPPSKTVGPMKIGIRWEGNVDIDLYASATPESETLFFEHTRAPEGYYFKDHRSSPEREYEFIEFETPVDVFKVRASINFFEGHAPQGASGEIRIEFEGRIYTDTFALPAREGNKGRSGRGQSEFWSRIDVPRVLKLRSPEQAEAGL